MQKINKIEKSNYRIVEDYITEEFVLPIIKIELKSRLKLKV